VYGTVNNQQEVALRQTLSSGEHLLSVINDVLDLTKIEAGMMELFIEEVDLNQELASVISVGKGLVKDKPLALDADLDELPRTYGDRRRLRQVLLNLVSNAAKFTRAGRIYVTATHDDETIRIAVQDTGIGIASEDQDKVFESFKQAKHDLTGAVGTGLGMPISRHFVEMHQGRMWFKSTPGVGSTFYVELPILTRQQVEASSQTAGQPA
jgi:signal transduction histidine kinase